MYALVRYTKLTVTVVCNVDFGLHNLPLALLLFEDKVRPSFLSFFLCFFAYLFFVLPLDFSLDLGSPLQLGDNQWLRLRW